jgi:TolA-binding protein
MKRTERQHLKDNELTRLALSARQMLDEQKGLLTALVVAIALVAVGAIGYYAWRTRVQSRAYALLTEATAVDDTPVGPPTDPTAADKGSRFPTEQAKAEAAAAKYKTVADSYPSTDAGLFARYREGATLMTLNKPAEAAVAFQDVMGRDASGVYGRMAKLGLAEAQVRSGQFDQAIAAYKELADRQDDALPLDGVLMQLGRTYLSAGKPMEAQQTFNRIVMEFPESQFSAEARQQLESLKKT